MTRLIACPECAAELGRARTNCEQCLTLNPNALTLTLNPNALTAHEPTDPPWLTAALDAAGRGDFRAVADALTQEDE